MEQILKKIKTNVIASALLCIIMGVVLVAWPGMSVHIVCITVGAVTIVGGLSRLLTFALNRDGSLFSQMNLIMGLIITLIGAWILFQPDTIIAMIPILVGIIIIIHGINNIQQAVDLYRNRYDKWWVALLLGLITVIFGGLLIFNPFGAVNTLVMFIGLFLIYDGISDIWIVSRVSGMAKQLMDEVQEDEEQDF